MAVSYSRFDKADYSSIYNDIFMYDNEYDFNILSSMLWNCHDVICKEYCDRYVDEKDLQDVNSILEDIQNSMRQVISDTEWLSVHGQEQAKHKIFYLETYIAENGYCDDFSEVELSDDPLDNYILLVTSGNDFEISQLNINYKDQKLFGQNLFQENAYYNQNRNSIEVCIGFLEEGSFFNTAQTYEEKLGSLGCVLAHELSHAYDPNGSWYDYDGSLNPWMTDEEYEDYSDRAESIKNFFDGMEIGDGITIDGEKICAETFSDLLGMECCLKILEQMEDPDYDAFFNAYARFSACYYNEDGLKYVVDNDTHLPYKERINYTLGQFDMFYETYDVDPESPYYVPKEKRLSAM